MKKKTSAGSIVAILTAVLTIVSLVVYTVNINGDGFFHGASVNNMMLFSILAAVAALLAAILGRVSKDNRLLSLITGCLQIVAPCLVAFCLINLVGSRVEGLGQIYFSNADVKAATQTAENLASAKTTIASMVLYGVTMLFGIVASFFNLNKS